MSPCFLRNTLQLPGNLITEIALVVDVNYRFILYELNMSMLALILHLDVLVTTLHSVKEAIPGFQ